MKIEITVATNRVGSEDTRIVKIEDAEILHLSGQALEDHISDIVVTEIINNELIRWNWREVD